MALFYHGKPSSVRHRLLLAQLDMVSREPGHNCPLTLLSNLSRSTAAPEFAQEAAERLAGAVKMLTYLTFYENLIALG